MAGCQLHDCFFAELLPREFSGNAAFVHHQRSVRHPQNLFHFAAHKQNRDTLCGKVFHQSVDFLLRPDIDSTRRLVQQQNFRLHDQPFPQHDLLLVTSGQKLHNLTFIGGPDAQPLDHSGRITGFLHSIQKTESSLEFSESCKPNVGANGHLQNHTLLFAVFGDQSDTSLNGIIRTSQPDLLPFDPGMALMGSRDSVCDLDKARAHLGFDPAPLRASLRSYASRL